MIESRDIFRRLQISSGLVVVNQDDCELCGMNPINDEHEICSSCKTCLNKLSQKDKRKIHKHLIDLGDKKRATILWKKFNLDRQASQLSKMRKKLNITQAVLAKKTGVKRSLIAQIEVGIRPFPKRLLNQISKLLQKKGDMHVS